MPRGLVLGTPRGLALVLFECQWVFLALDNPRVCHWFYKYAKGSGTHFISEFLINRLRAVVQIDCTVACNRAMGRYSKFFFGCPECVQSCSAFSFWGFVEMGFRIEKTLYLYNKNERGPRPLCDKDCDSMDGNKHKATAQRMPNGRTTRLE